MPRCKVLVAGPSRRISFNMDPSSWSVTLLSGSLGAARSRELTASAALMPQGRQHAAAEPIERALQNVGGRVLIDDSGAAGARHIGRDQLTLDRGSRQPLVPQRD